MIWPIFHHNAKCPGNFKFWVILTPNTPGRGTPLLFGDDITGILNRDAVGACYETWRKNVNQFNFRLYEVSEVGSWCGCFV